MGTINYKLNEIQKLIELQKHDVALTDTLFQPMLNKVLSFLEVRKERTSKPGMVVIAGGSHNHTCKDASCMKSTFSALMNDDVVNNFIVEKLSGEVVCKDILRCYNCNKPISSRIKPTTAKLNDVSVKLDDPKWADDKELITYIHGIYNDFNKRKSYNFKANFKLSAYLTYKLIKLIDDRS